MKNVTVTFTGKQAQTLLTMISNDTYEMEQGGSDKKYIKENDRIEARLRKAIAKAEGRI